MKLVLLNGCATLGQVAALEEAGVPIIIATNAPVGDKAAKDFAVLFFENLAGGKTVRFAFEQARATFSATAGKADPFLIPSGENRGMVFREAKDKAKPAWVFSCKEKRFEEWTLEMGIRDPKPMLSSIQEGNSCIRFLLIGKKYSIALEGKFTQEIEQGTLAIYSIDLEEVTLNREKVERELRSADAVVFTVDEISFPRYWNSDAFAYTKSIIIEIGLKTVFLKDVCTDEDVERYSVDVGQKDEAVIIPRMKGCDLAQCFEAFGTAAGYKNLHAELESDVLKPFKKRFSIVTERLISEIEDFDLREQNKFFGEWEPKKKVTLVCMEGTSKCGLNLLFQKFIGHVGKELDGQRFGLDFRSHEGAVENKEILLSKLYFHLFRSKQEKPVSAELFYPRFIEKLEENPLCLIFDDPQLTLNGPKLLVDFWKELIGKLENANEEIKPLFIVVINRSFDKGLRFSEYVQNLLDSDILEIPLIPRVEPITPGIFGEWFGSKKPRLQQHAEMQALRDNAEDVLRDPYLEPVIGEICNALGYPQLHSMIFKEPLA